MTIRRARRRSNFTIVNNNIINDERLSMKARGLLVYMLSKPDDWVFYETEITKAGPDGRDAIRSGIREIEQAGYLRRDPIKRDGNGKFQSKDWLLYDTPQTENPRTENPSTENPTTDNPTTDNPTLLRTNSTKTNSTKTDSTKTNNNKEPRQQQKRPSFIEAWEKAGFGMINGYAIENLQHWVKDYNGQEEIVVKAIQTAAATSPRAPLKYVEGILKSWETKGIKTLSDIEAEEAKHKKQQPQEENEWAKQNAEALNF